MPRRSVRSSSQEGKEPLEDTVFDTDMNKIGLIPLMALIYYEVSGGPFGIEDAVGAGGPQMALLAFVLLPFVWSIPEALVTAELATTFPEDSGYVAWVTEAFGPFWGFQEGVWSWVSGVTDNALYPVLFLDYAADVWEPLKGGWTRHVLLVVVTALLTYLNYRGLVLVGRTAVVLGVFSILPFVAMVGYGAFHVQPELWDFHRPTAADLDTVNWGKLLNVVFWNVNYWDSVSTLAGEVRNPGRVFPRALMGTVVLMIVTYCLPLFVGTGICLHNETYVDTCIPSSHWKDGYFSKVANALGGPGLEGWLVLCAALSNIGLFEAEMSSDSYQLCGMGETGFLPACFAHRSKHGTPTLGILFSCIGVLFVSIHGFSAIVEMLNFVYCFAELLEFTAFLYLRWKRPDLYRPFRVPLGMFGLIVLLLPAYIFLFIIMFLASRDTLLIAAAVFLLGLLLYPLTGIARSKNWCRFRSKSPGGGGGDERLERDPLLPGSSIQHPTPAAAGGGTGRSTRSV